MLCRRRAGRRDRHGASSGWERRSSEAQPQPCAHPSDTSRENGEHAAAVSSPFTPLGDSCTASYVSRNTTEVVICAPVVIYSFYSSVFGVPIAITFTRFFYVWIAVQQRDRAALYVFVYLCSFLCTASLPCCFSIMHDLIATAARLPRGAAPISHSPPPPPSSADRRPPTRLGFGFGFGFGSV